MGSPPPTDAPDPSVQDASAADAGFQESPIGIELCGFKLPFGFTFSLKIPGFSIPGLDFPPHFDIGIALSCDVDAQVQAPDGGGREGTTGLDNDKEFPDA